MIRDFTSETEEKLLEAVDFVGGDGMFSSSFGDLYKKMILQIKPSAEDTSAEEYVEYMNEYYVAVIEKNESTRKQIKKIFDDVYDVDALYNMRFCALKEANDSFLDSVNALRSVLKKGNFNKTGMSNAKEKIKINVNYEKMFRNIANHYGLLESHIEDMDPDELNKALTKLADIYIKSNHLEKEEEFIIPLGPNIEFYHKRKTELGNPDAPLNYEYEKDGETKFKNFSAKIPLGNENAFLKFSSKGSLSIGAKTDNSSAKVTIDDKGLHPEIGVNFGNVSAKGLCDRNGTGFVLTCTEGKDKYSLKVQENLYKRKIEFSVETNPKEGYKRTETEGLNIRNPAMGVRAVNWQFMEIPEPVVSPYAEKESNFEWCISTDILKWTAFAIGVVGTAGGVVAASGGIIAGGKALIAAGAEVAKTLAGTGAAAALASNPT